MGRRVGGWFRHCIGNYGVYIPTRNDKLDHHRSVHLDRCLVEEVRLVFPLLDCVDRSRDEQGMPAHWFNVGNISILVNVDMKKDAAVYVLPLCLSRIARVHFCNQKTSDYALSNPYMRMAGNAG
jgi:hypothetical protein